jgi:hypothetical protein
MSLKKSFIFAGMKLQMLLDRCAKCVSKRETREVGNGKTRTIETHNQFCSTLGSCFFGCWPNNTTEYVHAHKEESSFFQ